MIVDVAKAQRVRVKERRTGDSREPVWARLANLGAVSVLQPALPPWDLNQQSDSGLTFYQRERPGDGEGGALGSSWAGGQTPAHDSDSQCVLPTRRRSLRGMCAYGPYFLSFLR